jgi:AAA+ superfamily predicted ATPase
MDPSHGFSDSAAHLRAELGYLDLMLKRALMIARATRPSSDPEAFRGLLITEEAVGKLIETVHFDGADWPTQLPITKLDEEIEARRRENNERITASLRSGRKLSFPRLVQRCGLKEAEADLVLIALAPELDARYEAIYAYLQNDMTRTRPEVQLALHLMCSSFKDRTAMRWLLASSAPLFRLRILELGENAHDRRPTLLHRFLKLDDSVVAFLLDQPPASSPGVKAVLPKVTAPHLTFSAKTRTALEALKQRLGQKALGSNILHLFGKTGAPLEEAARTIGWSLQCPLLMLDAGRLKDEPDLETAIVRDAVLWDAIPVLRRQSRPDSAADRAQADAAEVQFLSRLSEAGVNAIVLGGDDLHRFPPEARLWRIAVELPDAAQRRDFWVTATQGQILDADPQRLADMFPFGTQEILQAIGLAFTSAALRNPAQPAPAMTDLVEAGRVLATPNLKRFAATVTPHYDWDDLVLPADRKRQLRTVAGRVANRHLVQQDWGFGKKLSRGRGVAVLLSGPPGCGKTMAAEVLARVLSLELFQIDLSTVVSKYIGETEKQLSAIFAEAERSQCILFFDECDAIFGKRTEVKTAHDRYANTEVNYLLQRLEQYDGVVLLATNFQTNIDEAFLRRLHDSIDFPMPDEAAREEIWSRQFPKQAPVDPELDYNFLATQFKLPGGNIRNAAFYAAYLAAEEGGRDATIRMEHVLEGVRREFQKQGKLVMASDMGSYAGAKREARG